MITNGDISPDTTDRTDFGTTGTGSGGVLYGFTVNNTGNANLSISSVAATGADADLFRIVSFPENLPYGDSDYLYILFKPLTNGLKQASIQILFNGISPFTFSLQGTGDENADSDGDGMTGGWEVDNSLDPNADDSGDDEEPDGLTNLEEYIHSTDPNSEDSDNDGLTDFDEINTHLTDPADADSDDDGASDGREINEGTDPLDPASKPKSSGGGGGGFSFGTASSQEEGFPLALIMLFCTIMGLRMSAGSIRK